MPKEPARGPASPPPAKPGGRPRAVDLREVSNSIHYIVRGGFSWRMMPHDLPPWSTCYDFFRKWRNDGLWRRINDTLRDQVQLQAERKKSPNMAIVDSQSVMTSEHGGPRGKDAYRMVSGRKRPLIVDTLGLILAVVVRSAGIQHRDGANGRALSPLTLNAISTLPSPTASRVKAALEEMPPGRLVLHHITSKKEGTRRRPGAHQPIRYGPFTSTDRADGKAPRKARRTTPQL